MNLKDKFTLKGLFKNGKKQNIELQVLSKDIKLKDNNMDYQTIDIGGKNTNSIKIIIQPSKISWRYILPGFAYLNAYSDIFSRVKESSPVSKS